MPLTKRENRRYSRHPFFRMVVIGAAFGLVLSVLSQHLFPTIERVETWTGTGQEGWIQTYAALQKSMSPCAPIERWSKMPFEVAYYQGLEFVETGGKERIAHELDFIRNPDAARDQIEMQLYDVDGVSAEFYQKVADLMAEMGLEVQYRMAFASDLDAWPHVRYRLGSDLERVDFIGAPVVWDEHLDEVFRAQAESWMTDGDASGGEQVAEIVKAAGTAAIAAANHLSYEDLSTADLTDAKLVKVYLALQAPLEDVDVKAVPAISFKSGWDATPVTLAYDGCGFELR